MVQVDASSILYVRHLPYNINSSDLYNIFGKYGTIRQIRRGTSDSAKGTAFVVFDDKEDAAKALEKLSGFQVSGRNKTTNKSDITLSIHN
ncbi:hypothetical protein FG386_003524 [Cryptosporidium ryanae]|uniref:uncharacterized protein n=1 Tax=Cryptosporidium ryanae TaxID=515981 RepID=UPI003519F8A3|nr:hypothetical protein FG386_003524 [Cryptosporidium ryanae]